MPGSWLPVPHRLGTTPFAIPRDAFPASWIEMDHPGGVILEAR